MKKIVKKVQELFGENNILTNTPYLIDICLLNHYIENVEIKKEKEFFEKNPSRGKFVNIPYWGSPVAPNTGQTYT